jgi:FkbM family methyltransferase
MMLAQVPESRIIAIEPQQEIVDFLRRNLKRFSSERWEVIEAGLSDRDGVGAMQTSIANRGAARLISEPTPSSQQVRLLEASTFFGALPRVDLIKMDVEGHEETVLRSASATIKRLQPKAILFEDQLGQAAPDGRIGVILEDCGYTVFGVHKSLLSTKIIPLQRKDRPRFNDYLAVSRSRRLPRSAIERYGLVASANG